MTAKSQKSAGWLGLSEVCASPGPPHNQAVPAYSYTRSRSCNTISPRVDPDCIGVFYRKKNLRACRFYYVKSRIWPGRPSVQYDNSGAIPRNAVERQDFVELGAFELNWAFYSWEPMETGVMVLFVWQNGKSWYKCRFRVFFFFPYGRSYSEFDNYTKDNDTKMIART